MKHPNHPDTGLAEIISVHCSRSNKKATLTAVHDLCKAMYELGDHDFRLTAVAKIVADHGLVSFSTVISGTHKGFGAVVKAWRAYANGPEVELDPSWPYDHPEVIFQRLLAVPKQREAKAAAIRRVQQVCRDRFARGERNFRPAVVDQEVAAQGIYAPGTLSSEVSNGFGELLRGWQALANERGITADDSLPPSHPDAVLKRLLQSRDEKTSQHRFYIGLHEVCKARVERGEYDLSRLAIAKELAQVGVFSGETTPLWKLKSKSSYTQLLNAWQEAADARWISADASLPPTNPHRVYRRLAKSVERADAQQRLLGLHRVCFQNHADGSHDFSFKTIGKLCAARGLMDERYIMGARSDVYGLLVQAWDAYAQPPDQALVLGNPQRQQKSQDLEFDWVRREHPQFEEWRALAAEWMTRFKSGVGTKVSALTAFFKHYLTRPDVPKKPFDLLRRGTRLPDFAEVACPAADSTRMSYNNQLYEFLEWVLLRDCSIEADDGERVVSPAFRNPIARLLGMKGTGRAETAKDPLPYGYVHELRRILAPGLSFSDWKFAHHAQGAVIGELGGPNRSWFTVDRSLIDTNDPDCVWRRRDVKGKVSFQIWSPVRWVAILIKLILPLRTSQVRWLDSGESDTWKYVDGQWLLNDHNLASGTKGKPWAQGVLSRLPASAVEPETTVLYISTNKTADRDKSGPEKGYVLPWFVAPEKLDDAYYWLEKLRNWQTKYNPISRRTSWLELDARHTQVKSRAERANYADTCFLFRAAEKGERLRAMPISDSEVSYAWIALLTELQDRLAARGEQHIDGDPIRLVTLDEAGRGSSPFMLHCLRVSLVSALAFEGNVPFAILQKLVGHARLLMTLYYAKAGGARKQEVLAEATRKLDANKEASIHTFLKNTEHDRLVQKAICNNKPSLSVAIPIHPAERNPAGWMPMHHGMCLVGGNTSELEGNRKIGGCFNGGPDIGTPGQPIFGPVPGGSRNCVRCRWFVTEPHYLPALAAHFNTIAYHFDEARNSSISAEVTLQELKRAKAGAEAKGKVFDRLQDLRHAERIWESRIKRFSDICEDLVACWRLIERCKDALNEGQSDGIQLMLQGQASEIEAVFEETESELLQLVGVCENVKLYPDLDPGKAVIRRSQLLDSALYNEGLSPMFLTLSESEQLSVGNAFVQRLSRLANSDNQRLGQRTVVNIIDAGAKLSESLGIDLVDSLPELLANQLAPKALGSSREKEVIEA